MKFIMIEKVSSGYRTMEGAIYWEDYTGEFHKKHGPAVIHDCGRHYWFNHGECYKAMNVEDDDLQIAEIMKEINFQKIHKVMVLLDWRWGLQQTIPSVDDLKQEALRILNSLKKYRNERDPCYIACGGFYGFASRQGFGLQFAIENWETT